MKEETFETIEQIISEAVKEGFTKANFNIRDLKKQTNLIQVKRYVEATLQQDRKLGAGSSRTTYIISPKFVIKVANNLKVGIAQNKAEVEVFKTAPDYVTKIFDYDPGGRWIVTEPVREFIEQEDFSNAKGFQLLDLKTITVNPELKKLFLALGNRERDADHLYSVLRRQGEYVDRDGLSAMFEPDNKRWIEGLFNFIDSSDLAMGDFWFIGHWGKTMDGRVVLLDSGATEEIMQQYYRGGTD